MIWALVAIAVLAVLIVVVNWLAPDSTQKHLAERAAAVARDHGPAASATRAPGSTASRPESHD
jgi:lipopolysaccharide export LptBFGC system permease protein LptF